MASKYINEGAAWGRIDGTRIERGQVFTPTGEERRTKRYKIRPATEKEIAGNADADTPAAPAEPGFTEADLKPYHTGGGWYTLPGGVRKHGKAKALAHMRGE